MATVRFVYVYDFGSDWRLTIRLVEDRHVPGRCRRSASPESARRRPEETAGPPGIRNGRQLDAIGPAGAARMSCALSLPPRFDPRHFDLSAANTRLRATGATEPVGRRGAGICRRRRTAPGRRHAAGLATRLLGGVKRAPNRLENAALRGARRVEARRADRHHARPQVGRDHRAGGAASRNPARAARPSLRGGRRLVASRQIRSVSKAAGWPSALNSSMRPRDPRIGLPGRAGRCSARSSARAAIR